MDGPKGDEPLPQHMEPQQDFTSHTIAMRAALEHCVGELKFLLGDDILGEDPNEDGGIRHRLDRWSQEVSSRHQLSEEARNALAPALLTKERRKRALDIFLGKWKNEEPESVPIDVVKIVRGECANGGKDGGDGNIEIELSSLDFKQRYVYGNIPAIVRDLGEEEGPFFPLASKWNKDSVKEWFLRNVGSDTMVPVKKPASSTRDETLDADGRAIECDEVEMSMKDWIDYCQSSNGATRPKEKPLYLKDWHLVQFLEGKGVSQALDDSPLYSVPTVFSRDILNPFLLRFIGGDFRFCYWGPAGSYTALHSDVLHTFSWSFNVIGEKKWTFYPPTVGSDKSDGETNLLRSFVLTQKEGDAIFVPSGWKHEVVNVIETISVNHNWCTAASVDRVWECITVEIAAVEKEADAWKLPKEDWASRENMLRGCIGLDVTAFFFALLVSLLDDLAWFGGESCGEDDDSERYFDSFHLTRQLLVMMDNDAATMGACNCDHSLSKRLSAILSSEHRAHEALLVAKKASQAFSVLFESQSIFQ